MASTSPAEKMGEKAGGEDPAENAPLSAQLVNEEKAEASKKDPAEREANVTDYLRLFTYATKLDFFLMGFGALSSIGAGVTLPLMNVVFGRLVGNFSDYFTPGNTLSKGAFEKILDKQALYVFALFVARFGTNYINKFCFRMIGIRMSAGLRLDYLRSLFRQSVHVLDSMPSGAAASTITTTANTIQLGISEKLGVFVEFGAMIVTAIIIAFTYSWSLTLVTASVILFICLVLGILLPFIIRGETRRLRAQKVAGSIATEAFSGIRMVTSCGAEERIARKYAEWVEKAKKYGHDIAPLVSLQFGLIFFSLYAVFGLAFWYGTKSYVEGRIGNVGDVVVVLMSVMMMVISLQQMSSPLIAMSKAMAAAAEFFIVIDAPKPENGTLREPDVTATDDIVFTDVHFAYPSRPTKKVLDGLNLRIEAHKNTAIVGPSGSGKSTIVGLIQGWYTLHEQHAIAKTVDQEKKKKKAAAEKKKKKEKKDQGQGDTTDDLSDDDESTVNAASEDAGPPVELRGTISTCGHRLEELDIKWWRSQIGFVQQEPFLFNDTIFRNVAAGLVGTELEGASEEEKRKLVKEACVESFADEFIDRLPHGYDTQVGESGTKLSGGQRQRIAIARSIISQPKILILDEATSAIDVRGERIVQASLERASRGRTTITIAHRLSTIKNADRICVLQNGRLVEEGTHDSLLANPEGAYYGLVHAQKLSLGDTEDDEGDTLEEEEDISAVLEREKSAAAQTEGEDETKQAQVWKTKNLFNGFGKLLAEQKKRTPLYVICIVGAMGAGAGIPVHGYLFAKVITIFQDAMSKMVHQAAFWACMWVALSAGIGLSYFSAGLAASVAEHSISATYSQQYFGSLLHQPISYFDQDDNSTGQVSSRLAADPQALRELLGINLVLVLTALFTLIGSLAISFAFGWKLALVALCVTIPLGVVSGYFRMRYELHFNEMNEVVFQESSKFGAEAIGAFRTVTSLVLEDSICKRYEDLLDNHVRTALRKARWTSAIFAFSDSVSLGCQALILWYGGRLLATREYGITAFFVTFMSVIQGAETAGQWLGMGPNAAQAAAAASRILKVRDSQARDSISTSEQIPDLDGTSAGAGADADVGKDGTAAAGAGGVRIELRDVYFKYPTRDVSIFRGLNLTIEAGQFAALVGASGSGKTTIVSLLERFYDPARGQILLNGRDIREVNIYEYRKMLSLVAQEPSLFQGTIRENILLGVDPSQVSEEQLHQVCRDANIHDFIVSLPEGYETKIGSRGVSLSGGQKQRLSIARALVRNPRVLLLDEATSSLDSESEKLVQAAFERVSKGRTTVAVAHRLATIQNADVIYVLGEGKVLEKGSHTELLKRKGVYFHMCHNQALDR